MSHSLLGKDVDDVLVEFYGPHTGRNYFSTVAPQLSIQVSGANPLDSVIVEKNTTLALMGTNNSNAIGSTPVRGGKLLPTRESGDWTPIGAAELVGDGLQIRALPAESFEHGIRVRVIVKTDGTQGNGGVDVATQWN